MSQDLTQVVYQMMAQPKRRKHLANQVAAYLISERQTDKLDSLLRNVESLRLSNDGILEVTVTSARPLSEANRQSIKKLFKSREIIIHEKQDTSLLGGARVSAHDQEIDFSVRTRLQRLKKGTDL